MRVLFLAAALAATASAECANGCSGKGECGNNDQCVCYNGYMGADCSLRTCASGFAFVDVPNGDLNHDGVQSNTAASGFSKVQWSKYLQSEYWPNKAGAHEYTATGGVAIGTDGGAYVAATNEAHFYTECSGKGVCDRSSGECACYDGYTGAACQRTTCPNDCSGRGVCRTLKAIAAGSLNKKFVDSAGGANVYSGVTQNFEYRLYDADKNQACVCDLGYGGVDCSLRECPRGDDPLTHRNADCNGVACVDEIQGFTLAEASGTYQITFNDVNGIAWTTNTFPIDNSAANDVNAATVKKALEALPNNVVGDVTVSLNKIAAGHMRYLVTFTTLPGNIPPMSVQRITGTNVVVQPNQAVHRIAFGTTTIPATSIAASIAPSDQSSYRKAELTGSKTGQTIGNMYAVSGNIQDAFNAIPAVKYQLGSTGVTVIDDISGTANDYVVVFGANANKPDVSMALGGNPILVDTILSKLDTQDGNKEYSICSNRGMCDYSTGLCACFAGYVGGACETQNALAM